MRKACEGRASVWKLHEMGKCGKILEGNGGKRGRIRGEKDARGSLGRACDGAGKSLKGEGQNVRETLDGGAKENSDKIHEGKEIRMGGESHNEHGRVSKEQCIETRGC